MRRCAHWLDSFGSYDSGFHVEMRGLDQQGQPKQRTFYLIATDSYGPIIPSMPAILCAKKLANGELQRRGAYPCLDVITLPEYLAVLESKKIVTSVC